MHIQHAAHSNVRSHSPTQILLMQVHLGVRVFVCACVSVCVCSLTAEIRESPEHDARGGHLHRHTRSTAHTVAHAYA